MAAKKFDLTIDHWFMLFREMLKVFSYAWWRVGIINFYVFFSIIAGLLICGLLTFVVLGGLSGVENIIANLSHGGTPYLEPYQWIGLGIILFLIFNVFLLFSILAKIAILLVFRNYTQKKENKLAVMFFVESWQYLWRLVMLNFWAYWPVYLYGLLWFSYLVGNDIMAIMATYGFQTEGNKIIFITMVLSLIPMIPYLIYRSIQVVFYDYYLVHYNLSINESIPNILALVRHNWWGIFGFFLLYGIVIIALFIGFGIIIGIFSLFSFLGDNIPFFITEGFRLFFNLGLQFFVNPIIQNAFAFFFMLFLAHKKGIHKAENTNIPFTQE